MTSYYHNIIVIKINKWCITPSLYINVFLWHLSTIHAETHTSLLFVDIQLAHLEIQFITVPLPAVKKHSFYWPHLASNSHPRQLVLCIVSDVPVLPGSFSYTFFLLLKLILHEQKSDWLSWTAQQAWLNFFIVYVVEIVQLFKRFWFMRHSGRSSHSWLFL